MRDYSHKRINQGDIYWIQLEAKGSESSLSHPHVVIQEDVINHSRVDTVVVCALTSNMKRANEPGNVRLKLGEANLPKESVVIISQISSVDKAQLGEYIGSVDHQRVNQIVAGLRFQQTLFFAR